MASPASRSPPSALSLHNCEKPQIRLFPDDYGAEALAGWILVTKATADIVPAECTSQQALHVSDPNWVALLASAPADEEVAAAGGGVLGEQAVEDAHHLHHACVLAQIVLGLGQEQVPVAVRPQKLDLRAAGCDTLGTDAVKVHVADSTS